MREVVCGGLFYILCHKLKGEKICLLTVPILSAVSIEANLPCAAVVNKIMPETWKRTFILRLKTVPFRTSVLNSLIPAQPNKQRVINVPYAEAIPIRMPCEINAAANVDIC
jgi:hypothetical protein